MSIEELKKLYEELKACFTKFRGEINTEADIPVWDFNGCMLFAPLKESGQNVPVFFSATGVAYCLHDESSTSFNQSIDYKGWGYFQHTIKDQTWKNILLEDVFSEDVDGVLSVAYFDSETCVSISDDWGQQKFDKSVLQKICELTVLLGTFYTEFNTLVDDLYSAADDTDDDM